MAKDFNNKVVWITGASSGIGEALAVAISGLNARLILSARREEELNRVKGNCAEGSEVRILPLDLSDADALESKTKEAEVYQNQGRRRRWPSSRSSRQEQR